MVPSLTKTYFGAILPIIHRKHHITMFLASNILNFCIENSF
ncbi:MAG: hypothetical protein ACI8RD_006292, partial [Bacillariaceae sp.]